MRTAIRIMYVPEISPALKKNSKSQILSVNFTGGMEPELEWKPYDRNRLIRTNTSDYIHVSFQNFQARLQGRFSREATISHIKNILTFGIEIQGRVFIFCGHSNSQLHSKACFFYAAETHLEISNKINAVGEFSTIDDVGKRAKRVGLLFTSSRDYIRLPVRNTAEIDDVVRNGKNFTDGCGIMSQAFAEDIQKKLFSRSPMMGLDKRYRPQVYQIRYKGCKGTIVANKEMSLCDFDPTLQLDRGTRVLFRKSMKKFQMLDPMEELLILEHSRPTNPGKLNAELASILSSLGVPDHVFIDKLHQYFAFVASAFQDEQSAVNFLYQRVKDGTVLKLKRHFHDHPGLRYNGKSFRDNLPRWIKDEIVESQNSELGLSFDRKNHLERVHILIPKSRLLFGVCDYTGTLKEGEVIVKITTNRRSLVTESITGELFVGRNPCLHPGDIQKFVGVANIPELDHLVDCIVFSTKGDNPPASHLSGGDLDGDKFFVCWDQELMPKRIVQPFDYLSLGQQAPIPFHNLENQQLDMIEYFARFDVVTLGKLTEMYGQWIRVNKEERAFSQECLAINELYSKAVDGEHVVIPNNLLNPPRILSNNFILDQLTDIVKDRLTMEFPDFSAEDCNKGFEKFGGKAPVDFSQRRPNGLSPAEKIARIVERAQWQYGRK